MPAVVYVWDRKEQHKEEIPELAKKLQHYDPEVSLAVRFARDSGSEGGDEGEDGLDEFISSHGFEYVDGERGRRIPTGDVSSFSDEDSAGACTCDLPRGLGTHHYMSTGVPGLPRVIDALSTIMWPSLVQTQRTSSRRKSRGGDLLDWASIEDPHGTNGEAPLLQNKDTTARQSRLKKEMDELESWLQDELDASQAEDGDGDDDLGSNSKKDHDDPWSTAHGREVDGYHDLNFAGDDGDEHKFDDDFDDFVGAPMDVTYGDSPSPARDSTTTRYPPSLAVSQPSTSKAPHRTFTSDFVAFTDRDVAHEDEIEEDEEDGEMPSRVEIEEMSRQLFGSAGSLVVPTTSSEWQRLHSPSMPSNSTELPPHPSKDSDTGRTTNEDSNFERLGAEEDEEEEDFELGAFDLSKVLGALQGMKEQIAGMEDEGERRRAAAKVALGLVYGLQKEEERDSQRA